MRKSKSTHPHDDFLAAVKGVVINNDRALLLKGIGKDDAPYWDLPGGRVKLEEKLEEALKREVKEELPGSKVVDISDPVWAVTEWHTINKRWMITVFYSVRLDSEEVKHSDEHTEHRWVALNELDTIEKTTETKAFEGYLTAVKKALQA